MFHHFHKENEISYGQGSITSEQFENIIKFIGVNRILNLEDWLEIQNIKRPKKNFVCLTFDDALFSQYEIALPVLEKYNLQAFWFIYSSVFKGCLEEFEIFRKFRSIYFKSFDLFYDKFLEEYLKFDFPKIVFEKYDNKFSNIKKNAPFYSDKDIKFRIIRDDIMSPKQFSTLIKSMMKQCGSSYKYISDNLWLNNKHLKKLSDKGQAIGLHGYNHPFQFSNLTYNQQFKQLKKNYEHILSITSEKPKIIAYPSNSYDERTIDIIIKLGIKSGFRSTMANTKLLKGSNTKFEIPRMDVSKIFF